MWFESKIYIHTLEILYFRTSFHNDVSNLLLIYNLENIVKRYRNIHYWSLSQIKAFVIVVERNENHKSQ